MTYDCGNARGWTKKEVAYDDKNCNNDCNAFNPVDRWLAGRKGCAKVLK